MAHELAYDATPIEKAVEKLLWQMDLYCRSQVPVEERYIVDFLLRDGKTIVECDGKEYHQERNHERDRFLVAKGFHVLHLAGRVCLNSVACRNAIETFIEDREYVRYVSDECKRDDLATFYFQ
jgi:very-short-patch-repair endonuclease